MQDETRDADFEKESRNALERIESIRNSYVRTRRFIEDHLKIAGTVTPGMPQNQVKKIIDLEAAQVSLMKAEEAFNDKFNPDDTDDIDFDVLRDQIGRALDRIRTLERSVDVFKEPDKRTD